MIKCTVTDKPLLEHSAKGYVFFVGEGESFSPEVKELLQEHYVLFENLVQEKKFTGKKGSTFAFPFMHNSSIAYIILSGIGKKQGLYYTLEMLREAVSRSIRCAENLKIESLVAHAANEKDFGHSIQYILQKMACISMKAAYAFDQFITEKDARIFKVESYTFVVESKDLESAQKGASIGITVAEAINRARLWVDLPANIMTPHSFADHAKQVAQDYNLNITIFNEDQIEKMGMGGLKAVGMGSQHDSHLVIVEYKTSKQNAPTLAFVGKGITFDSGGLNIKPTGYMEDMKDDMSGAAAVINAVAALSELKAEVNVIGFAALAENMVSGNANHPGDIITFYNGKTAIVGNTDAEGRLVLADALAYAEKNYKPDAMIDIATLTGACVHAVGPFFSGLMTQNEDLFSKIEAASITSGDHVWRLPLTEDYKVMVKGEHTDLCNDGKTKYKAGATNGACFLSNFVGDVPWAHIDIAPSAFNVPDKPYFRPGIATGMGTHLLIDIALQWKN